MHAQNHIKIAGLVILRISDHTVGVTFEEICLLILVPCNCFSLRVRSRSRIILFACILNASFHTSSYAPVWVW